MPDSHVTASEPSNRNGYRSFRLGLFGLDKLRDVPASLDRLATAFDAVLPR